MMGPKEARLVGYDPGLYATMATTATTTQTMEAYLLLSSWSAGDWDVGLAPTPEDWGMAVATVAAVSWPLKPGRGRLVEPEEASVTVVPGSVVTTPLVVMVVAAWVDTTGDAEVDVGGGGAGLAAKPTRDWSKSKTA